MPRRTRKTLKHFETLAREVSKIANDAHSISRRLQNLALKINDVEADLDGMKKWKIHLSKLENKKTPAKEEEKDFLSSQFSY